MSRFMMTSSNGNIFRVTDLCVENSPVTGEFPTQRPVTRSFDDFFDLRRNKCLNKQSLGWWFETPSRSLWRHCNGESWICFHSNFNKTTATCQHNGTAGGSYTRKQLKLSDDKKWDNSQKNHIDLELRWININEMGHGVVCFCDD